MKKKDTGIFESGLKKTNQLIDGQAIHAGNATSVVGTVRNEDHISELYYL